MTPSHFNAGQTPTLVISAQGLSPNAEISVSGGPFGATTLLSDSSGTVQFQEPVVGSTAGTYPIVLTDTSIDGHITLPGQDHRYFDHHQSRRQPVDQLRERRRVRGQRGGARFGSAGGLIADFSVTANSNGSFSSASFPIGSAQAGVYTMTAVGQTSGWTATEELAIRAVV